MKGRILERGFGLSVFIPPQGSAKDTTFPVQTCHASISSSNTQKALLVTRLHEDEPSRTKGFP